MCDDKQTTVAGPKDRACRECGWPREMGHDAGCVHRELERAREEVRRHLARPGEPEYAVILIKRSGHGAGELDYVLPAGRIEGLSAAGRRELLVVAAAMLSNLQELCGWPGAE